MKTIYTLVFLLAINLFSVNAQTPEKAAAYMDLITSKYAGISQSFWDYQASVAHGKSARKVDKRRKELLTNVAQAKANVKRTKSYEQDASLKDSVYQYLDVCFHVLNEDYAKIVDMEEVAEQSYDAMEAYMLAREMAGDKMQEASDMLGRVQTKFAETHDVKLMEGEQSELSKKIEISDAVFSSYNELYLIFFKSFKQEAYFMDAIAREDVSAMEQNNNALAPTAIEGIEKLKSVKAYKGDGSLKIATNKLLLFYKLESEKKAPILIDYFLKKETFEKTQKAFDQIKPSKRTQKDVDAFNKAVNEMNAAGTKYNNLQKELFDKRQTLINAWNKTAQKFLDTHVPKK